MKIGTGSFILGVLALIGGVIAAAMGHSEGVAIGLIMFALGFMAQLFEHEVVDCLYYTFAGVAALVFVLNFAQTTFGGHGGGHSAPHGSTEAAPASGEHH